MLTLAKPGQEEEGHNNGIDTWLSGWSLKTIIEKKQLYQFMFSLKGWELLGVLHAGTLEHYKY